MFKAALVGLGYWGPNFLRNLVENPDITVRWVCDLRPKRIQQFARKYPSISLTRDYRDVLSDTSVDLVVIATPVHTHFELAKQALMAGKHILVSKPLASSTVECQELIELAERFGRKLMVDHTFVYHPAVQAISKMVKDGKLGQLLYYYSSRMNLGLYQPDVSVIYDLMPHDLSILNELVKDDPIEISVSSKRVIGLPQPDIAFMQLNYQSNFIASIHASWLSPSKIRETIISGRRKMVSYDDNDVVQKVKVFDKGIDSPDNPNQQLTYTDYIQYRQGDVYSPAIPNTEALKLEIEHLVDCLEQDLTPKTDGQEGLRVVRILEHADKVAQTNRCWVAVPEPLRKAAPTTTKEHKPAEQELG